MNDFKLKRILVPTDTSDSSRLALDYARLFADRFGAEAVLFYADPILCPITFIDVAADGAPHKLFRDTTVIGTTTERVVRFARIPVLPVARATAAAARGA